MNELRLTFIFCFFFTIQNIAYSQFITGQIVDTGIPIEFANVVLKSKSDSSIIKFQYSDQLGKYRFSDIENGNYFIHVSFLGYEDFITPPFTFHETLTMENIHLKSIDSELEEITITAKKPLIEVHADKLVLNVANSILSSGDNALNLLRKAPGVLVDNNDNISLLGKSGVVVYLDGKKTSLSNEDLARMLKNMSSSEIERIEIITNPSAKYDAEGAAGIINIIRRKNNKSGFNGNLSGSYRRSTVDSYRSNLNLGFQNSKWDISNYFSGYDSKNTNWNDYTRIQNNKGIVTKSFLEHHSIGYGDRLRLDYQISDHHSIGTKLSYNTNQYHISDARSRTTIYNQALTQIDSILINDNHTIKEEYEDLAINFNYLYQGTNEKMLLVDLNSAIYNVSEKTFSPNIYKSEDEQKEYSRFTTTSEMPVTIYINTLKLDYERQYLKGKVSLGAKSAQVITENSFKIYNITGEEMSLNTDKSNEFIYKEWINAIYINYTRTLNKLGVQLGVRTELSDTEGILHTAKSQTDNEVKRKYNDIFPSATFTYTPNPKYQYQLSYSKRINRPDYDVLNPLEYQLDELNIQKGNAFLNPEYSTNIQFSQTYAQFLTTILSFSKTTDVITRLVDTLGTAGSYITWANIASNKTYGIGISAPIPINKFWSTFTNCNANRSINTIDEGDRQGFSLAVNTFTIYQQHTFNISDSWNAELSGHYVSPSIWEGTFRMDPMYAIDAGISMKFMSQKAKLSIKVNDIFQTRSWSGRSDYSGLNMEINGGNDSRKASVNFTYQFGSELKKSRDFSSGIDNETNRL